MGIKQANDLLTKARDKQMRMQAMRKPCSRLPLGSGGGGGGGIGVLTSKALNLT